MGPAPLAPVSAPASGPFAEPTPTAELLERLATALLELGLPVHRLEEAVERLARALRVSVDFVGAPTSLILAVGEGERAVVRVVRVQPRGADFARLHDLYALVGQIERRELGPTEACQRVMAIVASPTRYPWLPWLLAHGMLSASAAVLLGGGVLEVAVAGALGLVLGGGTRLGDGAHAHIGNLSPALAAAVASAVAYSLAHVAPEVSPLRLVLAAVLIFLPGYATTVGMTELATGNLVSGSARIAGALARFLLLALGVAVGERVVELLGLAAQGTLPPDSAPVFRGAEYLSPAVAGAAFTVILGARPRDLGWIVFVCYASTLGVYAGGVVLGASLSSFAGSFTAAAVSHITGRLRDRPSTVLVTPAMLLLVPGGVGFLGLSRLLHRDLDAGLELALRVALVAVAIAAGLMAASIAVPPRRSL